MASRYIFVNLGKACQAAASNGKANSGITLYGFSAQIWQVRIMVECLEACTQGSTADIRGYESEMRKRILKITKYIATHKRKRDLSSERSQADWFDGCCHINDVTAELRAKNPNKGLRPICRGTTACQNDITNPSFVYSNQFWVCHTIEMSFYDMCMRRNGLTQGSHSHLFISPGSSP